jgi:hypothetical protein
MERLTVPEKDMSPDGNVGRFAMSEAGRECTFAEARTAVKTKAP